MGIIQLESLFCWVIHCSSQMYILLLPIDINYINRWYNETSWSQKNLNLIFLLIYILLFPWISPLHFQLFCRSCHLISESILYLELLKLQYPLTYQGLKPLLTLFTPLLRPVIPAFSNVFKYFVFVPPNVFTLFKALASILDSFISPTLLIQPVCCYLSKNTSYSKL